MTVIASFDIAVPVRSIPPLSAEALTQALADLGLRVVLPEGLRVDERARYLPVRVLLENGAEIRTGLQLLWSEHTSPEEDEDDEQEEPSAEDGESEEPPAEDESDDESDDDDDDDESDDDDSDDVGPSSSDDDLDDDEEVRLLEGEVGSLTIWAKNAPSPGDPNEVPLALYFAAALAKLGDGKVVVHSWEGEPRDPEAVLEELDEDFDPAVEAWTDYPYDLFLAAEDGDAATIARLVAQGADVHAYDNQGVTPLMFALLHDNAAAAWELLRSGANPRAVNLFGKTAAQYASECSDAWLRDEIAARARFPYDELFELVVDGDSNGVIAALADGAPVDARTPEGYTLLMAAVRAEDENLVDALLRRGASVALVTESGTSALDVAESVGNVALQKVLRANGARPGRPRGA